ncbi:MAG: peptidase T [Bacteroidales bacterium]|jgi:tripeptide aminopeptidase|nr:peptidase T [Bacteroidales bacterium]
MNINEIEIKNALLERFTTYIAYDTQSDETTATRPSTRSQLFFAQYLSKEMQKMGLKEVKTDKNGYLTAFLPANTDKDIPAVGFFAHLDTSPSFRGICEHPRFVSPYNGGDIVLNEKENIVLSPQQFPELTQYQGDTIIHTDGTSLLGADDKAGIAEILTAMEILLKNPQIKHGKIGIAFTPDEEIGTGIDLFDIQAFGVNYAYTIDGGGIGELEFENFNAAKADIVIEGLNIHPGEAKNKMLNSQQIAIELETLLPPTEKPEYTDNYQGFFFLENITGSVEKTTMTYLIREHDKQKFEEKKKLLQNIVNQLNTKYNNKISCQIKDQYFNMKSQIEPVQFIVDIAKKAMQQAGVKPKIVPIRGGTDGAKLSFMGLPCPNIFTGGHNFHGKYEYIVVESMQKCVHTIVNIVKLFAQMDREA